MGVQVGKGVKVDKAEKVLAEAGGLVDGETVWMYAKCNQFKPMIDAVVVTNARIMGLSTGQGFKYKAPIAQITSTQYDQKKGIVEVTTTDGQVMSFKGVHSEDVPAVRHHLEYARGNPAPEHVSAALTQLGQAGSTVLATAGAGHEDYKAAKKAHKQELKQQRAQERAAEQTARAAEAGELVESGSFAGSSVKIYRNGFVRVGSIFTSNAPYERLLSIEASADVGKKSALGRGAGAIMTGGLNLLSSNKRGDSYLTIVTDLKTHVLHQDPPTALGMRASKKLEAAGNSVIRGVAALDAASDAGSDSTSPGGAGASVAERLRELSTMRDEGLVSPEEFEQLRARLLDAL